MWLIEDYTGPCSGHLYARKGDYVNVIKVVMDLSLVEVNGEKFYLRNEKISKVKIEKDVISVANKVEGPKARVNSKGRTRKA